MSKKIANILVSMILIATVTLATLPLLTGQLPQSDLASVSGGAIQSSVAGLPLAN